MEMIKGWVMDGVNWVGEKVGDGLQWAVGKTVGGILDGAGYSARFISNECYGVFIVFAMVGGLVYIAGNTKTGMKIIRVGVLGAIITQVVGVVL